MVLFLALYAWPNGWNGVDGLRAGIEVSSGTVLAGNVGAEERFEYTVIGDPVNEAARLTELAKDDGAHVPFRPRGPTDSARPRPRRRESPRRVS